MRLEGRDASRVLEAASALVEAATLEGLVERTFAAVHALIGCELVLYNEMEPGVPRSLAIGDPPEPLAGLNHVWEAHMHEHPILRYTARTGDTSALRISELVSPRAFRRTALWADLYRPMGIDDQLGCVIAVGPRRVTGVSASRGRRAFTDRERDLLEHLRPFLAAARRRVELERLLAAPALDGHDLTRREREVLALAVCGHTNREIAAELSVSARTVAKHLERAYAKLGVHGRREAAQLAR